MQQATDFLAESEDLDALISRLSDDDLEQLTAFKSWSINTVIRHLHFWNRMALLALQDGEAFRVALGPVSDALSGGASLAEHEARIIDLSGRALVNQWRSMYRELAEAYGRADPSQRCTWAGPSMSARSCITARQMETWAHGQEVYDCLGQVRINTDRLRNVVILGVNTFEWTFRVRGEEPPTPKPGLALEAPSGEQWVFGDLEAGSVIRGSAEAFAQVVTQTRHVEDTDLRYSGESAERWMYNAQCFFGGPTPPPSPGTRFTRIV